MIQFVKHTSSEKIRLFSFTEAMKKREQGLKQNPSRCNNLVGCSSKPHCSLCCVIAVTKPNSRVRNQNDNRKLGEGRRIRGQEREREQVQEREQKKQT